jgi:hypothetical protein
MRLCQEGKKLSRKVRKEGPRDFTGLHRKLCGYTRFFG